MRMISTGITIGMIKTSLKTIAKNRKRKFIRSTISLMSLKSMKEATVRTILDQKKVLEG